MEKPGELGNNHHYWRALAATSIGVLSNDEVLFRFGVDTFKQAVSQEDANGAFPLEMARHENAIHYQSFALQPLIMVAEFAARQNVDLYSINSNGDTSLTDYGIYVIKGGKLTFDKVIKTTPILPNGAGG